MGPSELLREFDKKFGQLLLSKKHLLQVRKLELFLQATNDALEDKLLFLFHDWVAEGGFTTNRKKLEEVVNLIAKQ